MYYKGQCKTHIRRQEGSGEHRRTVTHTSTEQYFDYKVGNQNFREVDGDSHPEWVPNLLNFQNKFFFIRTIGPNYSPTLRLIEIDLRVKTVGTLLVQEGGNLCEL